VNTFNGPLSVNGNLALVLGTLQNVNSFKGEVNVNGGSVTVGATTAVNTAATAGSITFNSANVTMASTAGLMPGMVVTGTNIAPGTTIQSITNATTLVLSKPAIGTSTATAVSLTFASGTTFDKLVTVGGSARSPANGGNTYTKGLLVESTGVVNNMTGNNTFGTIGDLTESVIFRQAGSLSMTGVNLFNAPLLIDGPLNLTLGSVLNSTTFKEAVTSHRRCPHLGRHDHDRELHDDQR